MRTVKQNPLEIDTDPEVWAKALARARGIKDPQRLRILREAVVALNECMMARVEIAKRGLTFETKWGPKPHPAVRIQHNASLRFSALMRTLDMCAVPPEKKKNPFGDLC